MTNAPKQAALAIVIHKDYVLLVKRKNEPDASLWGFIGGCSPPRSALRTKAVSQPRKEVRKTRRPRERFNASPDPTVCSGGARKTRMYARNHLLYDATKILEALTKST